MEERFHDRGDEEEDEPIPTTSTPETTADSPFSADEETHAPSPKKSRRGTHKRVVTVPLGGDGSKTEVYPPPDSWSWRKYGQKPIKGSPYPRGYYRCSSSKGCPARKQVERSRHDPAALMVTYSSEHNHPIPAKPHHHHHARGPPPPVLEEDAPAPASPSPPPEERAFAEFVGELGWVCDMGSTMIDEITFVGPAAWGDGADVEMFMPIGEEDQLLFGDLGDLPEYSVVFRRFVEETTALCGGSRLPTTNTFLQ